MRKVAFFYLIFFVFNSIFAQNRTQVTFGISNGTHDIANSKEDSLITIPVLKVADRGIDSILAKTTSQLNRFSNKCIDITFYKYKNDSNITLRIIGNIPDKWIGYSANLVGCVKENGYLIFIYDNCNLKHIFSNTTKIQTITKTAKTDDILINMPTWFYSYTRNKIILLRAP